MEKEQNEPLVLEDKKQEVIEREGKKILVETPAQEVVTHPPREYSLEFIDSILQQKDAEIASIEASKQTWIERKNAILSAE